MNRIAQLRQRQAELKAEATALLDAADRDSNSVLAGAAEARYGEIETELAALSEQIAAEEQRAERRRSLDAIAAAPPRFTSNELDPARTSGFRNLPEFAVAVRNACLPGGQADRRLLGGGQMRAAPTGYMETTGGGGEGYEVPVEYRDRIWELVTENDDVLGMVDAEPTMSRRVEMGADETTPWGSTGVQARWRSEGSQMTASSLVTKGRGVDVHELYAYVLATEELLEDAPRLNDRMTRQASRAIVWKASDAIVYGTGAGQPLGWFNSAALVSVAKEAAQTADTLDDQNILKMYSRLVVVPGDRPFWLANRDIVPQLGALQIGDQPMWFPPQAGLREAPGGFLLGYPIRWSEHSKTLGDKGDLQLVSPMGYYALRRTQGGPNFASSIHLFFDYGIEAFRWTFRFGGQPYLSAAVTPANGSNTKSHFVVLDERA